MTDAPGKTESLRSPLSRARGHGSAGAGAQHWWMQRLTAVALIPLTLYLLPQSWFFLPRPNDYASLIVQIGDPVTSVAMILAILFGFYHVALGLQAIIEDYVHGKGTRTAGLMLNTILCFSAAVAGIFSILYISFALYGNPVEG